MKKILFSIILISCLVVPMVGLADYWNITYGNKDFIINGVLVEGGIKLNVAFGAFDPGYVLPFESLTSYTSVDPVTEGGPMQFTPSSCTIRHDLSGYDVCCEKATSGGITVIVGCLGQSDSTTWTDCCLIDKILTIGDYIFILLLVVAVIVFLLAAWGFLTAQGEPEKVRSAKNFVIYSLIGIAVAFLAKVLVRVVASIMT